MWILKSVTNFQTIHGFGGVETFQMMKNLRNMKEINVMKDIKKNIAPFLSGLFPYSTFLRSILIFNRPSEQLYVIDSLRAVRAVRAV